MRKSLRVLKASSATLALAVALAGSPAAAFDELNWEWNKVVEETVIKNILIESTINPTGMTEIEKLQIQIGDVEAVSTVTDITNNPPAGEGGGGVIVIDETFEFTTIVDDSEDPSVIVAPVAGDPGGGPGLVDAVLTGGTEDEGSDELNFFVDVDGAIPFDVVPEDALDAPTELPTVASAATAVGNNQSIESAVSTQLHDAQILFDVNPDFFEDDGDGPPSDAALAGLLGIGAISGLGNTHTQIGLATAIAATVGAIEKAEISAFSSVDNILNARVDSDATAVGNNMSVDLSAAAPGDQLLIADVTQVSVADIMAESMVSNVTLNNYANLGDPSVNPIVNSTATAVGNNLNVNVGVPDLE
ncbi:MAG: hypothetical protein AAGE80_05205 [Pseudomonadota bacterium]